jgi:hypothetical protein
MLVLQSFADPQGSPALLRGCVTPHDLRLPCIEPHLLIIIASFCLLLQHTVCAMSAKERKYEKLDRAI